MNFTSPFLQSPRELAPGRDYAPAIAIYPDRDATITVDAAKIRIVISGDTIDVYYVGRSLEQVASAISVASQAVVANALAVAHLLPANYLFYSGETTPDGGFVVRMRGNVVRYLEETRIRALPPYPEHRLLPWFPRVDRGSVVYRKQGVDFRFAVPEYAEQEWSSTYGAPFVDVRGERVRPVNEQLLQLARRPVFWYCRNLSLTIDGIPMGSSIVQDVDVHNGYVRLTNRISTESKVLVDYTYRETSLVYKQVNLNPSLEHNPGIIDQTVLLYLEPVASSLGTLRSTGVRHAVGKTVLGAMAGIPTTPEPKLVIGAYQVRPTSTLTDLDLRDTRSRGGGLKEARLEDGPRRNPEAQAFADVGRWDGVSFPAGAAGVLKLPRNLLDSYEEGLMEKRVRRHMAAGGNVLLDFSEDLE